MQTTFLTEEEFQLENLKARYYKNYIIKNEIKDNGYDFMESSNV